MTDDSDPDDEFLDIDDPRAGTDPSAPPAIDLADMQAKYEASTQGDWSADEPDNWHGLSMRIYHEKDGGFEPIAQVQLSGWPKKIGRANGQFIVAAHNHMPAILARLAADAAEIDRVERENVLFRDMEDISAAMIGDLTYDNMQLRAEITRQRSQLSAMVDWIKARPEREIVFRHDTQQFGIDALAIIHPARPVEPHECDGGKTCGCEPRPGAGCRATIPEEAIRCETKASHP
jgi:hypothetical protein